MSYEDKYFEVEIEFRGFLFTPDMATLHLFTNRKYNLLAIALEDETYVHELVSSFEMETLVVAGVCGVVHDQPSPSMIDWYEDRVNQMAGELVLETAEFIEYNG